MTAAYVVAARRTPIARAGGALRLLTAGALAAPVLRAVLADAGLAPGDVDEVVLGNVWGPGGNPARVAALAADLGHAVPGLTVDRQCASGLAAIDVATRLVSDGGADVCLAGGVEATSTAPWRVARPATPYGTPAFVERAGFAPDGTDDPAMGPAADALAHAHGVARDRQDALALASHRRAVAADRAGRFAGEIVPTPPSDRAATAPPPPPPGGHPGAVTADTEPRARLTLRTLARMPPVFTPDGTATAGNTAPAADGAAAVAVVSHRVWRRLGVPALRIVGSATAGVDPALPGSGPVAATRRLLDRLPDGDLARADRTDRPGGDRAGLPGIDRIELTEAFAGQALACLDSLGVDALGPDADRVNTGGGAIALGHPWGASGAVLVCRLFTDLVRAPAVGPHGPPATGLAMIAGAGGVGVATLFARA